MPFTLRNLREDLEDETAELHGAFEVGGKITTKVKGNRALTTTITRIDEPRLWVGEAKWPGLTMAIEHLIVRSTAECS